jgi:flagellar biosynthesis/type III secretory pathway protein FliH
MTIAEQFRQEGIQQGLQQGIQQGVQQGMQKGRIETEKAIATKLIQQGIDIVQIKSLIELSLDEIEALKKENEQ